MRYAHRMSSRIAYSCLPGTVKLIRRLSTTRLARLLYVHREQRLALVSLKAGRVRSRQVEKGPFVQQEQPKGGSQRPDVHRLHVHVLERALGTHAQGVFAHQACMTITSTSIPSLVTRNVSSRLSNRTPDPMEAIQHVSSPNASLVPLPRSFLL